MLPLDCSHRQGFLPNARQQRAAGYAALELAQALRAAAAAAGAGQQPLTVSDAGSSGRPGGTGRHVFGWRDAMDVVVKWRQLAEPNDQVGAVYHGCVGKRVCCSLVAMKLVVIWRSPKKRRVLWHSQRDVELEGIAVVE